VSRLCYILHIVHKMLGPRPLSRSGSSTIPNSIWGSPLALASGCGLACWGNNEDEGIARISDVTGITDGEELRDGEETKCDFGENSEGAGWWN